MVRPRLDATADFQAGGEQHQRQARGKNSYGRQLARVHAPQYHETLFSQVYPGSQESSPTYLPVVQALQSFLAFSPEQRQRVILRTDAGFGSDANINHVLAERWQVVTKNKGGRRPQAFARQIVSAAWSDLGHERWVAPAVSPVTYVRPTQSLVLRWRAAQAQLKYAVVVCSILDWLPQEVIAYYDDRGACETEIQADKHGLQLEQRRKKRLAAQEALVLLTDVAHNLLAWLRHWMFSSGNLAQYGPLRLTEDVLCLPGHLVFERERLVEVQLNQLHPHAAEVAEAIQRLLSHFGHP